MLKTSDMNDEMKTETIELCVTACEKFSTNNEVTRLILIKAAQLIQIGSRPIIVFAINNKGSRSNDQRNSRQEIRSGVARDRGRRLRLRDHSRGQKSFIHVFRRHPGHLGVEVCVELYMNFFFTHSFIIIFMLN